MEYIPIGSMTMFVNVKTEQYNLYSADVLDDIKDNVHDYVNFHISNNNYFDLKIITDAKWTSGCLIGTITLGVATGAISAAGVYKFIKDYKDIREGLIRIFEDFKNLILVVWGKKNKITTKEKEGEEFKSQVIEILKKYPDEFSEYYLTGNSIYNEKSEIISIHRITIMREDLDENISEEKIKELIEEKKNS